MLTKEIIISRLAVIKHLYQIGLEQSKQVETVAAFSILPFHHDIKTDKFGFTDYWTSIPELTLKESMKRLNTRRNSIKHRGMFPSKADLEISRINTIDFFEENVKAQFDIEFKDVSLLTLIHNEQVRKLLEEAQNKLHKNEMESCINNTAFAFQELIDSYESSKLDYFHHSPFFFVEKLTLETSITKDTKERKLHSFLNDVKKSLQSLKGAIKIMSLGIEYKRYIKFDLLTPEVVQFSKGEYHVTHKWGMNKWTFENCQYCINFVMDSALKLQEFDFYTDEIFESGHFFKN